LLFFTIPVRFEFKDKDIRMQAETSLRKICGISCAVPYPKRLRDLMDKIVKEGKVAYPNCFIKTRVNIEKLLVTASAKTCNGWKDLDVSVQIPLDILDRVNNTAVPDEQMSLS
jgi:hypothetical protein